jgi:hypothetical protein
MIGEIKNKCLTYSDNEILILLQIRNSEGVLFAEPFIININ